MNGVKTPLYSKTFIILCLSHVLFSASFNMIVPELPSYLSSLGGENYKGLIIGLFTIMAGISRPFSGKLTDKVGRMPIMIFGTLVCVVASLFYPLIHTVFAFLVLRFLHGFSTGFKPTASTAYTADIVPAHRRGEAMGILGVSMNIGASISPPFGSMIANQFSIDYMFLSSSGLALISVLILLNLKETLKPKEKFSLKMLKLQHTDFIEPRAIAPALVVLFVYMCFGVLLTIVPDQSVAVGLQNKGLFFTSFTLCSILSRIIAGRASDIYGRRPVLKISIIALAIALYIMGQATTGFMLILSSGLVGFASGIASPSAFAWVIDRSPKEHLGRSMATVYIALELSITIGALVSAALYNNNAENFPKAFNFFSVVTLFAFIYLQWIYPQRKKKYIDQSYE